MSLLLSKGTSDAPSPLKESTPTSPRVLVIGSGVIGLTTAWLLLDQGFKVTILAKEWPSFAGRPRLSSQAAGALWKGLPPECGPQAVLDNLDTNQRYTLESYKVYIAVAATPGLQNVVEMRPCTVVTTDKINDNIIMSKKLE